MSMPHTTMVTSTFDEFILEVFEDQEDQFWFPLVSQKSARAFVKAIHSKGVSYEDIGREIDEMEHNFSAWRKGLGRIGIGKRMLERLNAPLQSLLDEDDEYDGPTLQEKIANINNKRVNGNNNSPAHTNGNASVTTTQNGSNDTPLHKLDRYSARDKANDLTESWTKRIEEKMEKIEAHREKKEEGDNNDEWSTEPMTREEKERSEATKVFERIRGKKSVQESEEKTEDHVDSKLENKDETREERLAKLQAKIAALKRKFPSHDSIDTSGKTSPKEKLASPKEEKSDMQPSIERQLSNSPKPEKKTPASPQPDKKSSPLPERKLSSSSSSKPHSPLLSRSSSRSDSPAVTRSESPLERLSMHTVPDITENYDSDLDIDDPSSTDNLELRNLVAKIRNFKNKQQDGQGYLYAFSMEDSDCVKIGASRYPTARLEQAQLFNPDLQMATSVPVSKRREALRQLKSELAAHKRDETDNWFTVPVNDVLDAVSNVAEKYSVDTSNC